MAAMMSWAFGILLIVVSYETANAESLLVNATNICLLKQGECPDSSSGTRLVGTLRGSVIDIFCDMKTNGGGYTFINPTYVSRLSSEELEVILSDRTSFLMVYRISDGTQHYAVLEQLKKYASTPLKLGLNEYQGYQSPKNKDVLGEPFLFFGFLPMTIASSKTRQGIRVNGEDVEFDNCDGNPNSQIVLFPEACGMKPSDYLQNVVDWPFSNKFFDNFSLLPTSLHVPTSYFMLAEMHFGGCGCYLQSNRIKDVTGVAIGFK